MIKTNDILKCKKSLHSTFTEGMDYRVSHVIKYKDGVYEIIIENNNGDESTVFNYINGIVWRYVYDYFYDETEIRELKLAELLKD